MSQAPKKWKLTPFPALAIQLLCELSFFMKLDA